MSFSTRKSYNVEFGHAQSCPEPEQGLGSNPVTTEPCKC